MPEQLHYTTARRMRYLQELPVAMQIGAIVDELRARGEPVSPAFADLCQRIDAIKAEVPKS